MTNIYIKKSYIIIIIIDYAFITKYPSLLSLKELIYVKKIMS